MKLTDYYTSDTLYTNVSIMANTAPANRNGKESDVKTIRSATRSVTDPVRFGGIHFIDGLKYAYIEVTPFVYDSISRCLCFINKIDISFPTNYQIDNNILKKQQSKVGKRLMEDFVKNEFINYNDYDFLYPEVAEQDDLPDDMSVIDNINQISSGDIVLDNKNKLDYLIITSNDLITGFSGLKSWKTQKCLSTNIISTSSIASYYHAQVTPALIKQFLNDINFYTTGLNKKWLVLGGGVNIVPTVYYNPHYLFETASIPSDIYYACPNLTTTYDGSWNSSDLEPQLYVSRISVNSVTEAQNYVSKLKKYEKGQANGNKILLAAYNINDSFNGYSDAYYAIEKIYNDYIQNNWSGYVYKLYDTGGDAVINKNSLFNQIDNNYGFVLEVSHGLYDRWLLGGDSYDYKTDLASAQSNYPGSVILTGACLTNAFDNTGGNCLSEEFTRNSMGGAVAYFGSSRTAYGSESVYSNYYQMSSEFSDLYNAKFLQHAFAGDIPLAPYSFGALTTQAKKDLIPSSVNNSFRDIYMDLQHSINPMGDPEMQIYTGVPQSFSTSNPPVNYYWHNNNYLKVFALTDCVISYLCDDYKLGITTQLQGGEYYTFYAPSNCSICVKKKNYKPYIVNITHPSGTATESLLLNIMASDSKFEVFLSTDENSNPTDIGNMWTLDVINMLTGNTVSSQNVTNIKASFDTLGWAKGIYALKVKAGNQMLSSKISVK